MEKVEQKNVFKRISLVMKEVGIVEKTGKVNFGGGYTYASDYDLLKKVNPAMVKAGLVMYPVKIKMLNKSVRDYCSNLNGLVTLQITYRVACTDNASYVDIVSIGQGVDRQDKAFAKAQTMCLKYALRQLILIPTGDDPDDIKDDPSADVSDDVKRIILKSSFCDNKEIRKLGGAKMEWDRSGDKDRFLHWWVEDTPVNRAKFKAFIPEAAKMIDKMKAWAEAHYHGFEAMDDFCVQTSKSKSSPTTWTDETIANFMEQMDIGNGIRTAYNTWYGNRYEQDEIASHNSVVPF